MVTPMNVAKTKAPTLSGPANKDNRAASPKISATPKVIVCNSSRRKPDPGIQIDKIAARRAPSDSTGRRDVTTQTQRASGR